MPRGGASSSERVCSAVRQCRSTNMKRSIHGRELRFRDAKLSFHLVQDDQTNITGVEIREGPTKTYDGRKQPKIVIWRHQLPSVISHLRWALAELPRRGGKDQVA